MSSQIHLPRRFVAAFRTALLALVCVAPGAACPLAAQVSTVSVSGIVADADKAVIPDARVTLVNRNNKFTRTARTNGDGAFTFSSISFGDYDLMVAVQGFRGYTLKGIHLDPGDTRTLPLIQLKVGEVSASVTVQANGLNQVDDSGERSSLITADELQKLTLQGRDVTELLKILPGSAISTGNGAIGQNSAVSNTVADSSNTQIAGSTSGYSMSGSPTNGVSIRSDGANLTDPGSFSGSLQNINNEATAEVKVEQQNFGADTANGPLVINAVSKAGGTEYHGSLYTYGRTSQLNSVDAFLKRLGYNKPPDRYIYPGGTFGGPVKIPGTDFNHNKRLTFFVQGEDIAQRETYAYGNVSNAIETALVPTAAMRQGDFSPAQLAQYLPPGSPICYAHPAVPCATPTNAATAALFTQYQNVHTVPIASYKGDSISCTGQPGDCETPYLDAGAKSQFNLLPLPNTPNGQTTADGYNFSQLNLVPNNLWTAHTKLEYKPSDRQTFSVSYTAEFGNTTVPQANDYYAAGSSGAVNAPGGSLRNFHTQSGSLNYTFNLSSTMTNEFFASLAYSDHYDSPRKPNLLNNAAIGYPYNGAYVNHTNQFPTLLDYGYDGLPLGVFPDYSFGPFYSKTFAPGLGDNFTKTRGKHTLKVGVNVDRPTINNIQTNIGGFPTNGGISNYYVSPSFNLPNDTTNYTSSCYGTAANDQFCNNSQGISNALANYEIGDFQGYVQSNLNPHLNMHEWSPSFYVNDDYKLTKTLSVNLGLRFDHLGRWTDAHGIGMPVWRPDLYNTDAIGSNSVPLPGFRWHGIDPSTPIGGYPTRAFFYSPRAGLSWDVYGNGKTTFSGGWGMYRFHEGQGDIQPVLAISNGLRTLTVSNPNFTTVGSKGLRMSYVQGLHVSADPNNTLATFASTITGYPTTTTPVFGLKQGDDESPLTETYSATVTQQMPGAMTFSIGYAGNKSMDLLNDGSNQQIVNDNVNALPVGSLFQADPNPQSRYYGVTYTASNIPGIPDEQVNDWRPYKHYEQLQVVGHTLYANYNSLQVTLNRSKGFLSFGTNYTFSKAMGVRGSYFNGVPGDSFNERNNYGPLSYDRSHIFNAWYNIQFGSHYHGFRVVRGAVNGWELSGNTNLQSGPNLQSNNYTTNFGLQGTIPATPTQQAYGLNNKSFLGTPDVQLQPLLTCNYGANLKRRQYINASCFAVPTQGGANGPFIYPYLHGPAYIASDLTAIKNFNLAESRSLQFRFAAFNFLNHPLPTFTNKAPTQTQLLFPITSNANFGQTTYTAGRRTVEIAVKYSF
jgi:hypothetical protein